MKLHKLLLALLLCAAPSWAALITIVLTPPTQPAFPGQVLTFNGMIASDSAVTLDLNSISVNLGSGFLVDVTPFFLGPLTLLPNTVSPNFALFTVEVANPFANPTGLYSGTISILGGAEVNNVYDPGVLDPLGSATFNIVVSNEPSSAVPEPATWQLVPAVGASLCFFHKRRSGEGLTSGIANVPAPPNFASRK